MIHLASSLSNNKKFLIFGGGYSGKYFAEKIREFGCLALTSSRKQRNDNNNFIFNIEEKIIPDKNIFEDVTHILSCIPPDNNGKDPVLKIFKNTINNLPLEWVGYLSTTGVYGNTYGDWVSEKDKPNPSQKRSLRRLNCEKEWLDNKFPTQIFRLPGIYGPGRSSLEAIKTKKAKIIHKNNQVFSRIHVADIANAIIYLLKNKDNLNFYQIINIADDEPCSQIEVLRYAYKLLELDMPKPILFEDAKDKLTPIAKSFWEENRRVSNDLLCKKLGYKLIYKNFRLGLKNCLDSMK